MIWTLQLFTPSLQMYKTYSQPLFYGPWSMRKNFETEYIPSYMNKISRKSKYEQQQKVY